MITCIKRTSLHSLTAIFLLASAVAQSPQAAPTATTIKDIQLSYKRDTRQVDPYRGIGAWASGPGYAGATAQDTVETKARAVDAKGQAVQASLEWISSDPEMVTVSPSQGDHVKITVHKPGESQLKITADGFSKELVVKANTTGKFIVFQITQAVAAKPGGNAAGMSPLLTDRKSQVSYAAGMRLAKTLRQQSLEADPDLVSQGIKDVLSSGHTLMTEAQENAALIGVETQLNVTETALERSRMAERNKQAGEQFLAENGKKEGVVTLPSGLQYKVIKAGDGNKPTVGDVAVCHYRGSLLDGTVFDDSHKKKNGGPVNFPLRSVIKGWQEALQLMPVGSKWQLFVPPQLAYGDRGVPRANIPPDATLVFDVELLSLKEQGNRAPSASSTAQKTELTPEQLDVLKKVIQAQKEAEAKPETSQ
jgi:FKBP-type peptidyl-prolyl cis-trans isomerase FklB